MGGCATIPYAANPVRFCPCWPEDNAGSYVILSLTHVGHVKGFCKTLIMRMKLRPDCLAVRAGEGLRECPLLRRSVGMPWGVDCPETESPVAPAGRRIGHFRARGRNDLGDPAISKGNPSKSVETSTRQTISWIGYESRSSAAEPVKFAPLRMVTMSVKAWATGAPGSAYDTILRILPWVVPSRPWKAGNYSYSFGIEVGVLNVGTEMTSLKSIMKAFDNGDAAAEPETQRRAAFASVEGCIRIPD